MTLDLHVIIALSATLLVVLVTGYAVWRTPPTPEPAPWVTQADVEAMLREHDVEQAGLRLAWADKFAADCRTHVTQADVVREISAFARGKQLDARLDAAVLRNEFDPLAGAFCRKSLDEGGELRARVLEILRAEMPRDVPGVLLSTTEPEPMTTQMKRNAVAAQVRLHAAAQKLATKRKARR